jgi:hypothetical protein
MYSVGFGDVTGPVAAVVPVNILPVAGQKCFSIFPKSDMDTCISTGIPVESMTFFVGIAVVAALWFFGGGKR